MIDQINNEIDLECDFKSDECNEFEERNEQNLNIEIP
jgi:hypothetical protein